MMWRNLLSGIFSVLFFFTAFLVVFFESPNQAWAQRLDFGLRFTSEVPAEIQQILLEDFHTLYGMEFSASHPLFLEMGIRKAPEWYGDWYGDWYGSFSFRAYSRASYQPFFQSFHQGYSPQLFLGREDDAQTVQGKEILEWLLARIRIVTTLDLKFPHDVEYAPNWAQLYPHAERKFLNPLSSWQIERFLNPYDPISSTCGVTLSEEAAAFVPKPNPRVVSSGSGEAVMSNPGVMFYAEGKKAQKLGILSLPGVGQVAVNSPLIGLVRIHPRMAREMLDSLKWSPSMPMSFYLRMRRIASLMHEARHSEGHEANLMFQHTLCPVGHRFQGRLSL